MKILSVVYIAEGRGGDFCSFLATLTVGLNVFYPCKHQGVALKGSPMLIGDKGTPQEGRSQEVALLLYFQIVLCIYILRNRGRSFTLVLLFVPHHVDDIQRQAYGGITSL